MQLYLRGQLIQAGEAGGKAAAMQPILLQTSSQQPKKLTILFFVVRNSQKSPAVGIVSADEMSHFSRFQ
jgi:hypothetical protein